MSQNSFLGLEALIQEGRPDHWPVAVDGERIVRWDEFRALIESYRRASRGERLRVVLTEQAPLRFLARLLSVIADGGTAVLPPNFQAVTLNELSSIPGRPVPHAAMELYTSGSSGEPKRVLKTLAQLDAECRVQESCWGTRAGDAVVVATTPCHHIYGMIFRLLWPLCAGRRFDSFTVTDPPMLFDRLASLGNTVLVSSPAHLSRLPDHAGIACAPPRLIFSSGGLLTKEAASRVRRLWGGAPVEIYGSTESGGIAWRQQDEDVRWKPLPGVILGNASDGALLVMSPFIDGADALRTEDRADLQDDGSFLLLGRLDRIVKIEEKRLSLPEMESWLAEHKGVAECAVAPLPLKGRTFVGAVVVPHPGYFDNRKAFVSALGEHVRRRFDPVLVPRRWRFVEQLPYNERGKLAADSVLSLLESSP